MSSNPLPPEILAMIFSYLRADIKRDSVYLMYNREKAARKTLDACALVNRRFNELSKLTRWTSLDLRCGCSKGDKSTDGFSDVLPRYASTVTTLALPDDAFLDSEVLELNDFIKGLVNVEHVIASPSVSRQQEYPDDFASEDDHMPMNRPLSYYDFTDIFKSVGPRLTSLSLSSSKGDKYGRGQGFFFLGTSLLKDILAFCPNLISLSLNVLLVEPGESTELIEAINSLSQLKHLKLDQIVIEDDGESSIFDDDKWTLALKSLTIKEIVIGEEDFLTLDKLHRFLNQFSSSLTHLTLDTDGVIPEILSLLSVPLRLPHLTSLVIAERNFLTFSSIQATSNIIQDLEIKCDDTSVQQRLSIIYLLQMRSLKNITMDIGYNAEVSQLNQRGVNLVIK